MYRPNGKQLQELRKAQGLTPYALGKRAGVRPYTITHWEGENARPDFYFNSLARLAKVLGVPYADLIEEVPDPVKAEETA